MLISPLDGLEEVDVVSHAAVELSSNGCSGGDQLFVKEEKTRFW